jgi:ABC-type phosphate/phosphonate transport system substrate-binding protein
MVASGEADIAAIDCVSFAHFQRLYPAVVSQVRILSWTPSGPSLPFITARSASDEVVRMLRSALADVFDDDGLAPVREQLLLSGVDLQPTEGFDEVLALERRAVEEGYPTIC